MLFRDFQKYRVWAVATSHQLALIYYNKVPQAIEFSRSHLGENRQLVTGRLNRGRVLHNADIHVTQERSMLGVMSF